MNFKKSFSFCFSTQNPFPDEFEDKKLELLPLVATIVTLQKETTLS